MSKSVDWKWVLLFAVINLSAVFLNHIDDTDETYGYYEPLHYLLYQKGMQTWEYSPAYAIRSYAFIYPLFTVAHVLRQLRVEKIHLFYSVRVLLGLCTSYAQGRLVTSLRERYKDDEASAKKGLSLISGLFLMCSPGVFYASTSFLPSAVSTTCTMLSMANWFEESAAGCIFWGSVAVLGTGWPFVGLIFLPFGLHLVCSSFHDDGFTGVIQLCLKGIIVVLLILLPVTIIDFVYYEQPTIPFWNILTYNTGNRGDELYGIEPPSYYVKNLLLTTGWAFPLTLLAPVVEIIQLILGWILHSKGLPANIPDGILITSFVSAAVWLTVLFSRPHKEERFLYPVYPLIALIAARCLLSSLHIFDLLSAVIVPSSMRKVWGIVVRHLVYSAVFLFAFVFAISRIVANHRNYHGYLSTWSMVYDTIAQEDPVRILQEPRLSNDVRVCAGGEWHLFPGHFFLPEHASLHYIEDGFTGILPQHFSPINGTSAFPPLPNNDLNQEENSRYVNIDACDYLITSTSVEEVANSLPPRSYSTNANDMSHEEVRARVKVVAAQPVIDRERTVSALQRALWQPPALQSWPALKKFLGDSSVVYRDYQILRIEVVSGDSKRNPIQRPPLRKYPAGIDEEVPQQNSAVENDHIDETVDDSESQVESERNGHEETVDDSESQVESERNGHEDYMEL